MLDIKKKTKGRFLSTQIKEEELLELKNRKFSKKRQSNLSDFTTNS